MLNTRAKHTFALLIVISVQWELTLGQSRGYESTELAVGAIIEKGDVNHEICFRKSVQEANKLLQKHDSQRRRLQLVPIIETIDGDDSFEASRKACKLLERQVIAIYGPITPNAVQSVQSLTNQFGIPHLQNDWGYHQTTQGFALNVHPHYLAFGQALYDYVRKAANWASVAVVYQDEQSLLKYDYLLRNFDPPVMLRKWDMMNDNHKYVIKQFKTMQSHFRFIVDIPFWQIPEFLELADSYNMTSQYYSYIFTDWDIQLVDSFTFKSVRGANITTFTILQPIIDEGYGIVQLLDEIQMISSRGQRNLPGAGMERGIGPTQSALLYDGMSLLAMGLLSASRTTELLPPTGMTCSSSRVWNPGLSLMNDIKAIQPGNFRGLTGTFQFDGNGWRSNIQLQIMERAPDGFRQFAYWNMDEGLIVTKNFSLAFQEMQSELKGKVLRITTTEEKPYMMYRGNTAPGEPKSTDSNDWEGYCIDLLNEIGKELNFTYVINLVPDATYGNMKIVDGEEVWDGMVQELKTRRADLAVGSFTITYDRARVIDFTTPFMYLGISIIYKRIEDKRSHLFSFLQPLSAPVWGYILAATIMVSLILFVVARFSPYEWKINHPCNVNSNVVENKFNVLNSFWFTFGALMQKGSDVVPHATSTRIIAGFWWFFTLIVISSYTANLAAFLTVARMESPIENAEDLAKQTKIKYGTRQGGSTIAFFEHSKFPTYKRMWQFMSSQKGLLMNTTPEAIRRVKREEYAYILESTMNEYYTQRDCQLMQIGGLLDSKGYGIGLPQGSIYRDPISETILKLQNDQILDKLKFRWWRERDINVTCDSNKKKSDTSSLGVEKVGGCFVMLLIGMGVSLMVSVLEFIYKSYHRMALSERSLSEELARDFRFSTACSSFRSQTAEDAMKLPPPQAIHCCAPPSDGNSRLGNALSYAPCLPSPQFPLKPTDLQDTLSVKLTGPTPPNLGMPESDSSSNVLMLNIKSDAGVQNHSPSPEKPQEVFAQPLPGDYRTVQSKLHPQELILNHHGDNVTDEQFHRMNNGYGVREHSRDSPEPEDLEPEEWLAGPSPNYSASPTAFSLRGHSSILPTRNQNL
ncbi:hypothetical protein EG68_03066 [Paragonimus skrjabini miyazakii]|uniref:Glutamate receptor 1 n=1 Tax=Paragonimus skrjabini miyazakii TaxID=59628 RepID=A0A8S9Z1F9_9TREM|nr:hypothetical protein EG68_03066 [Paragonimus skrjabini miyazakii]